MDTSTNIVSNRTAPSRWIGGIAGLVACLATAVAAGVVLVLADPNAWADPNGFVGGGGLVWIAIGGLPIAFFGGRALLPAARSGGWPTALGVGLFFGLIAPPLGAIEVILVGLLPFSGATSGFDDNVTGFLFILPIALVYSYVVVVLTVPAGLLWGVIVRAIPERGAR